MFDLNTPIWDEYNEELDEEQLADYIDALMNEFEESPEGAEFAEKFETSVQWAASYMHYTATYLGETPATMTARDTREVVFDIFPRKVSVESERAGEIIAELRAFWLFLKRTRSVEQADAMLDMLTDEDAEHLEADLSNPDNFGMAKSMFMLGQAAGFDMTTQEGLDEFMVAYNARILAARDSDGFEEDDAYESEESNFTAAPIRFESPRIGRNDPCPCGSGRKYKKCCGAT